MGHVRAHDPGGADFYLIEVADGGLGQIGREDLLELCGGVLMDQIQQIRLGVDLYIDLPQILVQLYQGQLDAGLHGIEHHRACILADDLSGDAELVGEHEADELFQNVAFGLVQVVKGAGADVGLLKDLLGRGVAALLGLDDFRKDAFATGIHAYLLQRKYPQAEIAFSCPRLRPIINNDRINPMDVHEAQLLQVVCAYRLLFPLH